MDLIGIHLRESIEAAGCPVCRNLEGFERGIIENILYEGVNDPGIRERFRKSLGLCPYHAWRLLNIAYSNPLYGGLGVATIYEDMLRTYVSSLKENKKIEGGKCYLCSLLEERERIMIESFAERLEELLDIYEKSEAILCKRHYEMLEEKLRENSELRERLRTIQISKLKRLHGLLSRFIEKFDYRSKEEPSEEEIRAVKGTIETLKGLPLPFGQKGERKRVSAYEFGRIKGRIKRTAGYLKLKKLKNRKG